MSRTYYQEAMRYIENAKETLSKAGIPPGSSYYGDVKYVKSAAGIAYAGVEQAAKWFLKLNGVKGPFTDIGEIRDGMRKINKKYLDYLDTCNNILHKAVYYQNEKKVAIVKEGMEAAKTFIGCLKQFDKVAEYKKGGRVKPINTTKS